jgi:hypothetical protein
LGANGIKFVRLQDFSVCPVWRYDEDDDLYYPVLQGKDLPISEKDVSIFVECKINTGHIFNGYIVGIGNVFSMGLFCDENIFYLNKNLPDLSCEQMQIFLKSTGLSSDVKVEQLLPITYATKINREEFLDFTGQFNMKFS